MFYGTKDEEREVQKTGVKVVKKKNNNDKIRDLISKYHFYLV